MCGPRRQQGWRSRAAFKLIELDDRFHLIRRGSRVIDLGAAPGGWSQVAVKRGAATVVGVDLLPIDPVPGATLLQGDFTTPTCRSGSPRCSAARPTSCCPTWRRTRPATPPPTTCASWRWPSWRSTSRSQMLAPGGGFVAKVFQGGSERQMLDGDEAAVRPASATPSRRPAARRAASCTWSRPASGRAQVGTGPRTAHRPRLRARVAAGLCGAAKVRGRLHVAGVPPPR